MIHRPPARHIRVRGLVSVGALLAVSGVLGGCGRAWRETPQAKARPGDLLVRTGGAQLTLIQGFRAAEPNSLLDGVVRLRQGKREQLLEINAVCSMPALPGWPTYDNVYGRPLRTATEARGSSGTTRWQVLFHFNGNVEPRMGALLGTWVARLRDNLCRRGDFDDARR